MGNIENNIGGIVLCIFSHVKKMIYPSMQHLQTLITQHEQIVRDGDPARKNRALHILRRLLELQTKARFLMATRHVEFGEEDGIRLEHEVAREWDVESPASVPIPSPVIHVYDDILCSVCHVPKILILDQDIQVCPQCARSTKCVDATSSHMNFAEDVEYNSTPYRVNTNFKNWMNRCQCNEPKVVPPEIIMAVMTHLYQIQGITNATDITLLHIQKALETSTLKKMKKYAAYIMQIYTKITGRSAFQLTQQQEMCFSIMFNAIQAPFKKHRPPERHNFLSAPYVLHKFCEILGFTQLLPCFPMLRTPKKRDEQDAIWEKICDELHWPFVPSNPKKVVVPPSLATAPHSSS